MHHIDVSALKASFRKACAENKIDPARGASSYDVARLTARAKMDAVRADIDDRLMARADSSARKMRAEGNGVIVPWWGDPAIWANGATKSRPTETIAMQAIRRATRHYGATTLLEDCDLGVGGDELRSMYRELYWSGEITPSMKYRQILPKVLSPITQAGIPMR